MATPNQSYPKHHPNKASFVCNQPKPKNAFKNGLDRVIDFLIAYWAHMATIGFGTLVLCAIAVPFLSYLGLDVISKSIFFNLHMTCGQIPSHSFFILGHQLGLCTRCLSIYTAMFLGSLIFVLTKKQLPGIRWWVWILMLFPMVLDGATQVFGWHESNWILRVITGTIFGVGNVWFGLPLMQKSLNEPPPPPPIHRHPNTL